MLILYRLEQYGGICDCQTTRDTVVYAASVEGRGLEATMEILGDVALRPRLTEEELEFTRTAVEFEIEDIGMRPDQEVLMNEAFHAAAFANNTLGLPKVCPADNIKAITREAILNYLSTYHTPDRYVLFSLIFKKSYYTLCKLCLGWCWQQWESTMTDLFAPPRSTW